MKSIFAIFSILSVFSIGVLSIFVMVNGNMHVHGGCIASTVNGFDCPESNGMVQFLNFHLSTFRGFSAGVFGVSVLSFVVFAMIIGFSPSLSENPRLLRAFGLNFNNLREIIFGEKERTSSWLSLSEHSPAFA